MKAENTLQIMMDFHGDLFYTRQKCLDHLFCVIGNGYEWKDGELIDTDVDERVTRYTFIKDIEHAEPSLETKMTGLQEEQILMTKIQLKSLENPKILEMLPQKWYPISEEYSYICNYPEDIKPDWLALINECISMLNNDGITVPENKPYDYNRR